MDGDLIRRLVEHAAPVLGLLAARLVSRWRWRRYYLRGGI